MEILIQTIRIYSPNTGMGFRIKKCSGVIMKKEKRQLTGGIEPLNQEWTKVFEANENFTNLVLLEADPQKMEKMKKIRKEFLRQARNFLETKFNSRNLAKRLDNWELSLVRYTQPFWKGTREELFGITKLMMMEKALHQRWFRQTICITKRKRKMIH